MLEEVLRRFGFGKKPTTRPATYFESLLSETQPRVVSALASDPAQDPLDAVIRQVVSLEAEKRHVAPPGFDDVSILNAARAYFTLLRENDRLPPSGQLNGRELRLTRQLLLSAAVGDSEVDHSEQVLSLLEEKFNGGKYTQAGLLLRLFETTPARERNNERTLFYEEMFGGKYDILFSR